MPHMSHNGLTCCTASLHMHNLWHVLDARCHTPGSRERHEPCKFLAHVRQDFLDISNPKAVLEMTLRGFSCLTRGDCICLHYNNKKYYIDITEAQPPGQHTPLTPHILVVLGDTPTWHVHHACVRTEARPKDASPPQ